MIAYKLTVDDIKKLNELIRITNSINTLYKKLEELETKNEKDSPLYNQTIEYLKIAMQVEDNKYTELCLTKEKSKTLINYILKELIKKDFFNNVNSILNKDYDNRILRRILNNLSKEYLKYKIDINFLTKDGLPKKESKYAKLQDFINNDLQVQNNFEEEMVRFYIEFLEDAIENEKNFTIREDLIASKYFSSFIFKSIENSMLENNFSKGSIIINSLFEADWCDIPKERYDILRGNYAIPYAVEEIMKLLEVKDSLYQDVNMRSLGKIRQYFLRAIFLFLDDETLTEINLSFHETLESEEFKRIYKDDIIGKSLIKDCFKRINTDRLEFEKIALGYNVNELNTK